MSGNDRPELRAYRELETLVRHLGEELAAFRRRALAAEAQVKDSGHGHGAKKSNAAMGERVADLETENESLKTRLGRGEDRVRQMMERVRFLRQQLQSQSAGAAAGGGVREREEESRPRDDPQ